MKIIDLLNKIAKGEEVPKKIAIQNEILIYNEDEILNLQDCYYKNDDEDATWEIWAYDLNDEVEIIEEEKEIEKINDYFREEEWFNEIGQQRLDNNFDTFASKINELIDVINDMRDKEC